MRIGDDQVDAAPAELFLQRCQHANPRKIHARRCREITDHRLDRAATGAVQFGENSAQHVIDIEIEQGRFRATGQHTHQSFVLRVALNVRELAGPGNSPEKCDVRCAGQRQQQQDGDQGREQNTLQNAEQQDPYQGQPEH